jgi:hypothetical protein
LFAVGGPSTSACCVQFGDKYVPGSAPGNGDDPNGRAKPPADGEPPEAESEAVLDGSDDAGGAESEGDVGVELGTVLPGADGVEEVDGDVVGGGSEPLPVGDCDALGLVEADGFALGFTCFGLTLLYPGAN